MVHSTGHSTQYTMHNAYYPIHNKQIQCNTQKMVIEEKAKAEEKRGGRRRKWEERRKRRRDPESLDQNRDQTPGPDSQNSRRSLSDHKRLFLRP